MSWILECDTTLDLLGVLFGARVVGWSPATQERARNLLERPALAAYVRHHTRISGGRLSADNLLEQLRALAENRLAPSAYLAPWTPLLARERKDLVSAVTAVRGQVTEATLRLRVGELLPKAELDADLTIALLPDGQSSGYCIGSTVVVDLSRLWLGAADLEAIEREVACAVFLTLDARRWRRWIGERSGALRTIGEQWAAELLARLMRSGVATRCLAGAPTLLTAVERQEWERCSRSPADSVEELCAQLRAARDGFDDLAAPARLHAHFAEGHYCRYQTMGAALVAILMAEDHASLVDALRDPRLLPGLLLEHGVPPDLAQWTMGLGEEGWSSARRPQLGIVRPAEPTAAGPAIWPAVVADEPLTSVTVAIPAGAAADPVDLEGMAHLVEHAIVARLSRAAGDVLSVHGYTEKEATLYTFVLDKMGAQAWPALMAALVDPLDVDATRLAELKDSVRPEVEEFARNVTAQLQARAEQRLFGPPFGRSLVGDPTSLSNMRPAHVAAFHRCHYRPGAIIIGAAGRELPLLPALGDPGTGSLPERVRPRTAHGLPPPPAGAPSGAWMLVARVGGKRSEERQELAALRWFWSEHLRQEYGEAATVDLTLYDGAGYLQLRVPEGPQTDPAQLRARLAAWVAGAKDELLLASTALEEQSYQELHRNPQSLSIWLAGRGLFFPEQPANLAAEAAYAGSAKPDAMRRLAVRIFSAETTTWVDAEPVAAAAVK